MNNNRNTETAQTEPVTIKPLAGMKPGVWLTILYILIIAIIIVGAGIVPDVMSSKTVTEFRNSGKSSAVYVDGSYIGGTPCAASLDTGVHSVQYRIGDISVETFEVDVPSRIFFNWLFPRKYVVERNSDIGTDAYLALTREFFLDVAAYSSIREYDNVYRYPPLFTNYANTVKDLGYNLQFLPFAAQFITTREMLSDAKTAFALLGIDYDFSPIEEAVKNGSFRSESLPVYDSPRGLDTLETDDFTVLGYIYGDGANEYSLAETPVNETMYAFFVRENPKWSRDNKKNLIAEGLVDDMYLEGVTLTTTRLSYKAVTNISYYAARAFCEWLSKKTETEVFLPSELQWTAASCSTDHTFLKTKTAIGANGVGPAGMIGGVWEFTSTYYVPNDNAVNSSIQEFLSMNNFVVNPIVKGGSYLSNVDTISSFTIGVASPDICTDTYGFRIAWK